MIQGFGYQFFNSVKDQTNNRFSPSIIAGYGPYNDLQTAITTILSIYNTDINKTNVTLFAPPLGLPFGIISGGKFTEYVYEKGNFEYANTAEGGSSDPGIVPTGSGESIALSDSIPTGQSGDTGSSTVALSTKGAYALAQTIANSNSGVTDVKVNNTSVVTTGVANIPVASDNALGVIQLGYSTNDTNKFALVKTSSNKAYVEIPQAYLVSAAQKQAIDALVEVYEDGTFITDPNMQPASGSGDYSELSSRLDRIEAILGQLMGNNAAQDATFIVENTQD